MRDKTCALIEPLLGAYIDGEVASETAETLANHVAACASCRRLLGQLAETERVLRSVEPEYPTEYQWDLVERRVLGAARARSVWQGARTAALAAAAAILVAAVVWLASLLDSGGEPALPPAGGATAQGGESDETPLEISIERG
jgi:predicted anti-sigma-YlaC factor YlaD